MGIAENTPEAPTPKDQSNIPDGGPSDKNQEGINNQNDKEGNSVQTGGIKNNSGNTNVAGGNITVNYHYYGEMISDVKKENVLQKDLRPRPAPDAPLQTRIEQLFINCLNTDADRFFVIVLGIFNGISYSDFRIIYQSVLNTLNIKDNSQQTENNSEAINTQSTIFETSSYEELAKQVDAEITRSKDGIKFVIRFTNDDYPEAIFDYLRRYKAGILLDLLPILRDIVRKYSYWDIRIKSSLATAEVAQIDLFRTYSQAFYEWAGDSRAYVRASVGYPLAKLASDEGLRSHIKDFLNDWSAIDLQAKNDIWRYRWTAASAFKQIGSLDYNWSIKWAFEGLKKLAGFDDIRIADSVIHSLVVLSIRGKIKELLIELKIWIDEDDEKKGPIDKRTRCIVAILAFFIISEIHIEDNNEDIGSIEGTLTAHTENLFDLVRQSGDEKNELWHLMVSIGTKSFKYKLDDPFFELGKRWTIYAANDPKMQNAVRNLFVDIYLELYSRKQSLYCEHILNHLSRYWQTNNKNKHLIEMAASIKTKIRTKIL